MARSRLQQCQLCRELGTITPQRGHDQPLIQDDTCAGRQKPSESRNVRLSMLDGDDRLSHGAAQSLVARPAEDEFGLTVPLGDATLSVHGHKRIQR